jgi:RNA polymerase sigma-70 factor (ECF subfamily)
MPDPLLNGQLRRSLLAFIRSRVRDATLAEDLTQETLLRMHRHIATLRHAGKLDAWMLRIARGVIADHFRRDRPASDLREDDADPTADDDPDTPLQREDRKLRADLAEYVRCVIAGLPAASREALQLVEYDGLSQVELARRLGISVSAAKSRVQRARSLLRATMERCCKWETDRYGSVIDVQPRKPAGGNCDHC